MKLRDSLKANIPDLAVNINDADRYFTGVPKFANRAQS